TEALFAHADQRGGFFTLILDPPQRNLSPQSSVLSPETLPRELIFVLDTSGSMSGLPIEKAKAVMSKAIDAMRDGDTFNIITFSGDEHILWDQPRPNTPANRDEAQAFLASRQGAGGTEMMRAINAALAQPALPAGARIPSRTDVATNPSPSVTDPSLSATDPSRGTIDPSRAVP